jgi:hypothetical protein
VSLRGRPIVQTASLADGREIRVRVGVPEDSYIPRRELETVDVNLFDGGQALAAVNTVLGPEQGGGARAGAGDRRRPRIGQPGRTAAAIEPLADRPR